MIDSELESCAARLDRRLYPLPHHHASLARARVQLAEGAREAARAELQRVIDDIRAGSAIRARAIELASGAGRQP